MYVAATQDIFLIHLIHPSVGKVLVNPKETTQPGTFPNMLVTHSHLAAHRSKGFRWPLSTIYITII